MPLEETFRCMRCSQQLTVQIRCAQTAARRLLPNNIPLITPSYTSYTSSSKAIVSSWGTMYDARSGWLVKGSFKTFGILSTPTIHSSPLPNTLGLYRYRNGRTTSDSSLSIGIQPADQWSVSRRSVANHGRPVDASVSTPAANPPANELWSIRYTPPPSSLRGYYSVQTLRVNSHTLGPLTVATRTTETKWSPLWIRQLHWDPHPISDTQSLAQVYLQIQTQNTQVNTASLVSCM